MKHTILVLFVLLIGLKVAPQNLYFVQFRDKQNGQYDISSPSNFLSQRALDRRLAQGIAVDSSDLPVSSSYIQQVANLGCNVKYSTKWLNGAVVEANAAQLQLLGQLSPVAEILHIYNASSKNISVDEKNGGGELDYGSSATQIQMLNGHVLHSNGFLGDGYLIAVLDAGFLNVDIHHAFDSIRQNGQILGTRDFVNPTSDIYREYYHGAAVLSTIAGNVDGQLIGTAPRANFWLIRTEDSRSEQLVEEYSWVAGAELADSVGADIINTSLGYSEFDDTLQNHVYADMNGSTAAITRGANKAAKCGMLVVVSAGNEGSSNWHYISAPADSPHVLTVGAVSSTGTVTSFSSRGPTSDGRIKPDVCAMGQSTVIATGTNSISTGNGTSFSAPIVAGMVACLWQANPELTRTELIELIRESSTFYSSPNNDIGYGIPNFACTLNCNEHTEPMGYTVFPNPAKDVLNIMLPTGGDAIVLVSVSTMLGRVVFESRMGVELGNLEIKLPKAMKHGLYIVSVVCGNKTFTSKFVKI